MGFERKKMIMIKILIVIVILLAIFTGVIAFINNQKVKVKFAVNYIFNTLNSAFESTESLSVTNIVLKNKAEINSKIIANVSLSNDVKNEIGPEAKNIENLINGSTIETDIKSDMPNNYTDIVLNYLYNSEELTANIGMDKDQMYVLIKDYFDKYIKIDMEKSYTKKISSLQAEDIKYMMDILRKSFVDAVSYGTISTSKVEIDINEVMVPVNKTTLTIDTKFINQVTTILLNKILMDDKAKQIIIKIDPVTYANEEALGVAILKHLITIQNTTANNVLGEYSLYTKGIFNNVVRNEITAFKYDNTVLQYTTYKTEKFDTQTSVYKNNDLMAQVNIKKTSGDNYDSSLTIGQNMSMDVKGIISNSKIDVDYTLRISGMDDFKGNVNVVTNKVSDNEINETFNIKLDTPEAYGTSNLKVTSTIKKIENITKPDLTKSISVDSITSEQWNQIYTKFKNRNPRMSGNINKFLVK